MTTQITSFQEEFSSKLPALSLLSNLGYQFISPSKCSKLRGSSIYHKNSQAILFSIKHEYLTKQRFPFAVKAIKTIDKLDYVVSIFHYYCNITVTLSTRKGNAQPWRFFFACKKVLGSLND